MNVVRRLSLTFKRSTLISNIEACKRKLIKASDEEKIRFELELKAFRQQVRLLDDISHA